MAASVANMVLAVPRHVLVEGRPAVIPSRTCRLFRADWHVSKALRCQPMLCNLVEATA